MILANINRNILLADMEHYVDRLLPQGMLVMSGFYEQNLPMIREKAESLGLVLENIGKKIAGPLPVLLL